jgi:hypothetical protein
LNSINNPKNFKMTFYLPHFKSVKSNFYLTHFTDLKHLPEILESRSIISPEKQREILKEKWIPGKYYNTAIGLGDIERYDKSVFLEMISSNLNSMNSSFIYFIFSPEVLIDSNAIFSKGWNYGKLKENNYMEYDNKKSLIYNLESWEAFRSEKGNRIEIMIPNQVSLNSNLVGIYIPEKDFQSLAVKDLILKHYDLKSKIFSNFNDFLAI